MLATPVFIDNQAEIIMLSSQSFRVMVGYWFLVYMFKTELN